MTAVAHLLVDCDGIVVRANDALLALVGAGDDAVGRRVCDLGLEDRGIPLTSLIQRLERCDRLAMTESLPWAVRGAEQRQLKIFLRRVARNGRRMGTSVALVDVAASADGEARQVGLLSANEELRQTKEELLAANAELLSTYVRLVNAGASGAPRWS